MENLNKIGEVIGNFAAKVVNITAEKVNNLIKNSITPSKKDKVSTDIDKTVTGTNLTRPELESKVLELKQKVSQTNLLEEKRVKGMDVEVHEDILLESGMGNFTKLILKGGTQEKTYENKEVDLKKCAEVQLKDFLEQTTKALNLYNQKFPNG